MSTTDFLKTLDLTQLKFCRDKCDEMIRAIENEEKKVAWVVTSDNFPVGWFRTEDYLKAVECLANVATSSAANESLQTLFGTKFAIQGQRLPASEYEALFADGQWG
ncbi:TPA: hypothetical protein ACJJXI_004246 [Enterobacter hormaechei subsp. xiangfangensis]